MKPGFFAELRRRNVIRMAGLYLVGAWLLVQLADTLLPMFGAPDWMPRSVVLLLALGFLPVLAFAWVFELTPDGLKRGSEISPEQSVSARTARRMTQVIVVLLLMALVYFAFDKFALAPRREAAIAETAVATAVAARTERKAPSAIPDKSIAVLPLANESGDKDQQYFSDGLSENLINALMQFNGLKVIGRNSAFQFRDSKDDAATISRKLGVTHLLEGSVRRVGNMVRINAQLIRAADGSGVWSQSFDRPYTDLFKLQDEITSAVAVALKARLLDEGGARPQGDRPPGGNIEAYAAMLRGRFHFVRGSEADQDQAIKQFEIATWIDPGYALAWAELSQAWTGKGQQFLAGGSAASAYAQARRAVDTALKLDPNLALAHAQQGNLLANVDFDWAGADAAYQRALRLAPHDPVAQFGRGQLLAILGQPAEAVKLTRGALEGDPLHAVWYTWLAGYLTALGQIDEARQAGLRSIELQPGSSSSYYQLTIVEIVAGNAEAALAAAKGEPPGAWQDMALALARQVGGDRVAADAALQVLIGKWADTAPYQIAEVYALRKDPDNAFKWLDHAWDVHDPGINYLLTDPLLLRYKDDPRFAAYCRKIGLPISAETTAGVAAARLAPPTA